MENLSAQKQIIFITGPTASGKSAVAVDLAEMIGAEIVSADAYQVYKGMPVLTAAPPREDMERVRHHMVGFLDVSESWDASAHYRMAMECIRDVQSRGKRVVVAGGSGLYLKFLSHGMSPAPPSDPALRASFSSRTLDDLASELSRIDPEGAAATNLTNRRYVERNLEIVLLGGKPLAFWKGNWQKAPAGPGWAIECPVDLLDERIMQRTQKMIEEGAIDEVARLTESKNCSATALKTLGLSQIRDYLEGKASRESCLASLSLATRQYAKRQRTWFRRESWLSKLHADRFSSSYQLASQVNMELSNIPS